MPLGFTQQVIIGLSPGRTGSKSIAHVLASQQYSSFTHEHAPKLPYKKDIALLNKNIEAVQNRYFHKKYLCFNGFFYTWYLPDLLKVFPNAKVYALTRDLEETVKSHYTKVTKRCEGDMKYKNYWNRKDRGRCKSDWEICFPDLGEGLLLKEVISKYIELYQTYIQCYQNVYGSQIKLFDIQELNESSKMLEFLRFVGIEEKDIRLPETKVQIVNRWFEVKERRGGKAIEFKGIENEN